MGITYRHPETEHIPGILKLLGDNDPPRRHIFTKKYWRWQFVDIPSGSICLVALDGDALAGFGALLGFEVVLNGRVQLVYEGAEFVVAKQYRGRGIFSRLAGDMYRSVMGRFHTYAFASPMSFGIYLSRLKHMFYGRFPYWVGFTNIEELGKRKAGLAGVAVGSGLAFLGMKTVKTNRIYDIRRLYSFGEEWKLDVYNEESGRFHLFKSQRYLNWRYIDHPFNNYTIIGAYLDSEPVGYAIIKGQDLVDIRFNNHDVLNALLNEVVTISRQSRIILLNTYMAVGPEERRILRQHGFVDVSCIQGRLLNGALYPVQRVMVGPGLSSGNLPGINYWYFTMGDMDCKL